MAKIKGNSVKINHGLNTKTGAHMGSGMPTPTGNPLGPKGTGK